MPRMKIRESARTSRIPLLRSLSGSLLIGSRRRSKSQSQSRSSDHPSTSDQDPDAPPVPSIPSTARTTDNTQTVQAHTPVTTSQPSISVTDTDRPSTESSPPSASSDNHRDVHDHDRTPIAAPVMMRKVWVKRPNASATRVEVNSDDLVDNLRDVILLKYANSLGRTIDSPDITLKIVTRDQLNANNGGPQERVLGPEEPVGRTLDENYPNGQGIDDALIIELAKNRSTPRPSPRPGNHQISYNGGYFIPQVQYGRPDDAAPDYFGPVQVNSPQMVQTQNGPMPSMAILATGQAPPLPSPGGGNGQRRRLARPNYARQHTSSPTVMHSSQAGGAGLIDPKAQLNGQPTAPIPTPPASTADAHKPSITPPNRVSSPRPGQRPKKKKSAGPRASTGGGATNGDTPKPASASLLDGTVPPINVLIVEDNVINLKLLEAFMKRLKVRWKSAQDGREAVNMWRQGGFHLVLMDIQLPVMNGLEATKEIRRLEGVNGIGVFGGKNGSGSNGAAMNGQGEMQPSISAEDNLGDKAGFKSPVIIVALTASSLQSDRHEALAAGCNDFLTKPVNFVWMERKVTEWGCMQALIDYDGWRKWKEYASAKAAAEDPVEREKREKEEKRKQKEALKAMFLKGPPGSSKKEKDKDEKSEDVGAAAGGGGGGRKSSLNGTNDDKVEGSARETSKETTTRDVAKKRQGKRGSSGSVISLGKGGQGEALGVVGEEDERGG